jgi:hypothetical protein
MTTLESQLAEYGELQEEMFGSIAVDEITTGIFVAKRPAGRFSLFGRRHPLALATAAMVAVLLVIGGITYLTRQAGGPDPVDQPVSEMFTWTFHPEGDNSLPYYPNTYEVAGHDGGFIANGNGNIWTSTDGGTWSRGPIGLGLRSGVAGGFLAEGVDGSGAGNGTYWRSADGESWTEVVSEAGQPPLPASFSWLGLNVDEILDLSLPASLGPPGAWSGTVLKVGNRFVAYYWNPEQILEGAVSDDGQSWERFETAAFLTEWFDFESPRSMGDRGFSDRLWSGVFTIGQDRVLALTADLDGHHLWESIDGIVWDEFASTLPEPLLSPPGPGTDPSIVATHHVTALSTGWTLTPWDRPFSPAGSSTYFSVDGRIWATLSPPDLIPDAPSSIRVVGDTIFFFTYSETSEAAHGLQVATVDDQVTES